MLRLHRFRHSKHLFGKQSFVLSVCTCIMPLARQVFQPQMSS